MTAATAANPAAGPGRQLWLLVRGPGRSTTRRLLQWLLAGLLALSVLVFATGLLTFVRVHDTAAVVRDRSVPVVGEVAAAKSALLQADHAAIVSFTAGGVRLAGPGDEFQNQIAVASQSLARAAEHNLAGDEGSGLLQLVEGSLVSYTGMIGQADAHFRQPGGEVLGTVDLWNASRLLHRPDGALVLQLDALLQKQRDALDQQLGGTAMTPIATLTLLLPAAALLALLVTANLVFRRRFRRSVNPWLVLAGAALIALTTICGQVIGVHRNLENTRDALSRLVADEQARDAVLDVPGQQALLALVSRTACGQPGGCGDTLARFVGQVTALRDPGPGIDDGALAAEARGVTDQAAAASAGAGLRPLIFLLAILLAGAVFLGFRARLYEYRYRPR